MTVKPHVSGLYLTAGAIFPSPSLLHYKKANIAEVKLDHPTSHEWEVKGGSHSKALLYSGFANPGASLPEFFGDQGPHGRLPLAKHQEDVQSLRRHS